VNCPMRRCWHSLSGMGEFTTWLAVTGALQQRLVSHLMPATGSLVLAVLKIRWPAMAKGKRGGARVVSGEHGTDG
jgi:hypothetical protein